MSDVGGEKSAEDVLATPQGGVVDDDDVAAGPEATRSPLSAEGCAATDEGQVAGAEEGAPDGAPDDLPPVPATFLYAAYGDEEKAKENWLETLRWRKENQIEQVLQAPQPQFKLIKRYYPWCYHRCDKRGNVCVYYRLGKLRLPKLWELGVSSEDIFQHNLFYQEYLWTVVRPLDSARVTIVFDLQGLSFTDVSTEVLQFIKNFLSLQSRHWPARTEKSLIVNAPTWFSYVFAIIRPLLNQRQRDKVSILDENSTLQGMMEVIDEHNIPKEYGGSGEHAIGECEEELRLWAYVTNVTVERHGLEFREEEGEGGAVGVGGQGEGEGREEGLDKSRGKGKEGEEAGSFAALTNWWFASGS